MNKKVLSVISFIVLVTIAGACVYGLRHNHPHYTDVVLQPPQNSSPNPATNKGPITVVGVMECLPPKSTNGVQNESCAIGIKQDNGTNYALNSDDPTTVGSLPTGQRVQITGILSQPSSQYDTAGTIHVTDVAPL